MTSFRTSGFAFLLALSAAACGTASDDDLGLASTIRDSLSWRDLVAFPNDPFVVIAGQDQPQWVKFSIMKSDPKRVVFQNSNEYPFHYDFAKEHIDEFRGLSPVEFERVSLHKEGQAVITGAVLYAPTPGVLEYGIQLARIDAYTKEEVEQYFDLVKASIKVEGARKVTGFYFPTFEQAAAAEADRAYLEQRGIPVGSPSRWLQGDACYSGGWALGRMQFVKGAELEAAYRDGRLLPDDVLLTDAVPAEVPRVAGIVSLTPSTPNSHVAILSNTFGTPFVYPHKETERERLKKLVGKDVLVRAKNRGDGDECRLDVVELDASLDAATRAQILESKKPEPASIDAKAKAGVFVKATDTLTPADVKFFGGKAANFGTLRRAIPENSPEAVGVSFDLWDAFMTQSIDGKPLREHVDGLLAGLTYPPDVRALEDRLKQIRKLVKDRATFTPEQRDQLAKAFAAAGFDPKRKLRFRSSTNVEDGAVLSGAGLYDSYSGCVADDLDSDDAGPSACDPTEAKEKGFLQAVKKTYASFYNTNAVLERLRYGIREQDVGMAMAVHYSFPDAEEAANGVATVQLTSWSLNMKLVTGLGADSVTNPEPGADPEVVEGRSYTVPDDVTVTLRKPSSRLTLGKTVMKWYEDYQNLGNLLAKASRQFVADHGQREEMTLDLEYKKTTDGALVVKQIREVPTADASRKVVPFLVSAKDQRLCTLQGEGGTVFAKHRLKQRWTIRSRNVRLDEAGLSQSLLSNTDVEFVQNGAVTKASGSPATWAAAKHSASPGDISRVTDSWTWSGAPAGVFSLSVTVPRAVPGDDVPVLFFGDGDYEKSLEASYDSPQHYVSFDGEGESILTTKQESTPLDACPEDNELDPSLQVRSANGITTSFYYRRLKTELFEKTAPLGNWEKTEITGLTSRPIVLRGYFSQTMLPGHHNFYEDFLFEPELEDGLDPQIAAELTAKDVRAVALLGASPGRNTAKAYVVRRDGRIEPLR